MCTKVASDLKIALDGKGENAVLITFRDGSFCCPSPFRHPCLVGFLKHKFIIINLLVPHYLSCWLNLQLITYIQEDRMIDRERGTAIERVRELEGERERERERLV